MSGSFVKSQVSETQRALSYAQLTAQRKCHSWFQTDTVIIFTPSAHFVKIANVLAPTCSPLSVLDLK